MAAVPGQPGPRTAENRDREDRETPLAIDLPGFTVVFAGVASGLRPFPDGIPWLAGKGYRTVLHLRAPGEDTAAARKLFEKNGLRYTSLEASPARLDRRLYEDFVRAVEDGASRPLFVYDKDGSVAGGLWYLYFRVHRREPDDRARAEAKRLGLRLDDDDAVEHRTMFLAVQKLLETLRP